VSQRVELGDPACLDELAQPRGDSGPDSAQVLHASRGDELRNRRLGLADGLGCAAVCARRVVPRPREIEQARERLELFGDRGVVQVGAHGPVSLAAWRHS